MFSTPLICSSSGEATVWAIVSGLAPGKLARTWMVGGTTSGYSLIGSICIDRSPAMVMTIDSTVAKMGRSMKNREMFMGRSRKRRGPRWP
jgi:hypothetical protein